jgi:integrase
VRVARTHIRQIVAEFGGVPLTAVRPSQVKAWIARLRAQGMEASYIYALHSRLLQIMSDAVHDGVLGPNLCSRRTSPPMGKAKVYVATTEQVWAIHDALPDHLQVAVLLGAFVGLRIAEVSGLRVADVDFIRGVVHPREQWRSKPLKTDGSEQSVPIPQDLALLLSASVQKYPSDMLVTNGHGTDRCGPWLIDRAVRAVREDIDGLPEGFSFHDFRHYSASVLIASGADIKTVQARMRHASARTTLDTYRHLWPDADESTRTAIGAVITERIASLGTTADGLRTKCPNPACFPRSAALAGSYIVVECELVRGRVEVVRRELVIPLVADPRVDQVGRENASLGEVFMVVLQAVDHRGQLGGGLRDIRGLFRWQVVEVLIHRGRRLYLVLDAVQAGHQHGRKREIRVARCVGTSELQPFGLRIVAGDGDAHAG